MSNGETQKQITVTVPPPPEQQRPGTFTTHNVIDVTPASAQPSEPIRRSITPDDVRHWFSAHVKQASKLGDFPVLTVDTWIEENDPIYLKLGAMLGGEPFLIVEPPANLESQDARAEAEDATLTPTTGVGVGIEPPEEDQIEQVARSQAQWELFEEKVNARKAVIKKELKEQQKKEEK